MPLYLPIILLFFIFIGIRRGISFSPQQGIRFDLSHFSGVIPTNQFEIFQDRNVIEMHLKGDSRKLLLRSKSSIMVINIEEEKGFRIGLRYFEECHSREITGGFNQ